MGRDYALKTPQIREAAELYRSGLSRRQVAAHFGVGETAARNALRLAGVQFRSRVEGSTAVLARWNRSMGRGIKETSRPSGLPAHDVRPRAGRAAVR